MHTYTHTLAHAHTHIDVTKRPEEEMCYDLFYLPISYITHSFLICNTISNDWCAIAATNFCSAVFFFIFSRFNWKFTSFTKTCLRVYAYSFQCCFFSAIVTLHIHLFLWLLLLLFFLLIFYIERGAVLF